MTEMSKDNGNEPPVRRLLRRKESQEYFTGNGWTSNLEEARSFQDSLEAAAICAQCGLLQVEMVLRVKGATSDLYCTEIR